nr:hypothetical protein [Tanacetum cinerariifolium]
MASEEIPGKIAHFVVDNFDDDSMKLKLSNGVISITPELVYKDLGVPLGGEDINRMNRLGNEDVTTLEWHSQFSRQANQLLDTLMKKQKLNLLIGANTPAIKYWTTELIKKREIFEISNGGFGLLHLYSDDSSDGDIFERELDSKMDKLDQKVTLLKLIVEDLEFEFSNSLMDHPNSSRRIRQGFYQRNNKENGEDSSEEEMIEEVNQKIIEADIVLQKSINDDVQNKELNCIDEDFQKVRERFLEDVQNEEQIFVKGTHEDKEEEILNQDSIEVNVLEVIEADNEDEFNVFNGKKKTSFDFKMFDIPKVDDKEKSAIGGFEDCLMKGLFRQVAKPDNSVRSFDIKPDIKDASVIVQPKREPGIAWYLKSPFKVRGSALNTYANTLSRTEVLTTDTLFIMDEETDPIEIVYSSCTNNVKIPILFLESLAPGLKIDELVIDAWADLLNFNESYM